MDVAWIEQALRALSPLSGTELRLVGIDGPGGAGKSTLAQALAQALTQALTRELAQTPADGRPEAVVIHGDDFYGPEERAWRDWSPREGYQHFFDHRRLEHDLLLPLRRGAPARFQCYDWSTRELGDWAELAPRGIVIVEGVYTLRSWLRPHWDLAVYVDTPREVRIRRLHARGENDPGWIAAWVAAEDYYLEVERPAEAADIVVPGW